MDLQGLNPLSLSGLNPFSYANNNPIGIAYSSYSVGRSVGGVYLFSDGNTGTDGLSAPRNTPTIPEWVNTLSTAIDHAFAILNPIRTALYISKFPNLWNLMRLDGVTQLPGVLSKVATGVGWTLSAISGLITGYEKYISGASISSSIAGGIINAGINIGGMYAAGALASLGMGLLAMAGVPGGIVVVAGAVAALIIGIGINHLFTKLEIGGNTIEGHLNNFIDWLIFWD